MAHDKEHMQFNNAKGAVRTAKPIRNSPAPRSVLRVFLKRMQHVWMPAALAAMALPGHAQNSAGFTAAQAAGSQSGYAQNCAGCHGANLDNGEFAPPLKGSGFSSQWAGQSVGELFTYIRTNMPPSNAGGLSDAEYLQITAFVLQSNGMEAGDKELSSDATALAAKIRLSGPSAAPANGSAAASAAASGSVSSPANPARVRAPGDSPGGGLSPYARLIPAPPKSNPADKLTPVTDALLQNPPPGEWLTWRRTYDDQGFSPLKQINKSNVGQLRLAWSWPHYL
jgi:alcohol dehydrogenase (cytochrome c)